MMKESRLPRTGMELNTGSRRNSRCNSSLCSALTSILPLTNVHLIRLLKRMPVLLSNGRMCGLSEVLRNTGNYKELQRNQENPTRRSTGSCRGVCIRNCAKRQLILLSHKILTELQLGVWRSERANKK